MSTDLTFFTNEPGASLADRFTQTLQVVKYFDVLVGYFRTSGFFRLADSLENVEKIRILVGLNLDQKAFEVIDTINTQQSFDFNSDKVTREAAMEAVIGEIDYSEDNYNTEYGIRKFIEFLSADCIDPEKDKENGGNGKKLEFRAYHQIQVHFQIYQI